MKTLYFSVSTSERRILEELDSYISLSFLIFEGMTAKEIAQKTKLSISTIYKYRNGWRTARMQGLTLMRFGAAAGLALKYDKNGIPKTVLKGVK